MQGVISLLIVAWIVAAWVTHWIACFTEAAWGLLIVGAIFFPIAFVHGTGVWFGAW